MDCCCDDVTWALLVLKQLNVCGVSQHWAAQDLLERLAAWAAQDLLERLAAWAALSLRTNLWQACYYRPNSRTGQFIEANNPTIKQDYH